MSNENKQLTLLEKFEQGWEIRANSGSVAVQVIKSKAAHNYIIEWDNGVVARNYYEGDGFIKLTPPKERKTLYLYEGLNNEFFTSTENLFYPLITTIHLEKNGDKWEVVNP